jgi:hypothetical protein
MGGGHLGALDTRLRRRAHVEADLASVALAISGGDGGEAAALASFDP